MFFIETVSDFGIKFDTVLVIFELLILQIK